ncbi:MAG: hypothetical protein ACTSRT_09585 [Promethearchaeota archaeon]
MPLRFNSCPHCQQRIVFKIENKDIDPSQYPAPVYIIHKDKGFPIKNLKRNPVE